MNIFTNDIKRAAFVGLLFLFTGILVNGQNPDKVYKIVYEMPEFKGGTDSLAKFLNENVKYPYEDRLNKNEGIVFLSFVIEKDGSVSSIVIDEKASKEATDAMRKEAKRVIESMPKWKPGRFDDGTPARVAFELPIGFYLGEPKKKGRRGRKR